MANDRNDMRDAPRDERRRRSGEGDWDHDRDRGFFERAGDEIASWFGDDEAERRRHEDRGHDDGPPRPRTWIDTRGGTDRGGWSEEDYNPNWRRELGGRDRGRAYRPVTGDYGRAEQESGQFFAASGYGRGSDDRSQGPWGRDEYRRTSRAGTWDKSDRSRHEDPHYDAWRQRQIDALDRDYDAYRRENQARFEDDFGNWRERRQKKRGMLGQVREHMEVTGSDGEHVGTVDRVAGDRIILAKSDPESGGAHHSLSCSDIDRVEGDRVILDCSADQARNRWRDESRSRALFERDDQGEMGARMLDRSFEGTYR
jgi:hypothetical protein